MQPAPAFQKYLQAIFKSLLSERRSGKTWQTLKVEKVSSHLAQRTFPHLIAQGRFAGQDDLVRQLILWLHYLGKTAMYNMTTFVQLQILANKGLAKNEGQL